jgi:hypothetical protein
VEIGSAALLSRYFLVRQTDLSVSAADASLVAGDPNRISLLVSCSNGGPIWITTKSKAQSNMGIVVNATALPFKTNWKDEPTLASLPWRVFGALGVNVTVIEVIEIPPADFFNSPGEVSPISDY